MIRLEPHRPNDTDTLSRALADVPLLPTPAVNDMGKAYTPDETPDEWDAWTERMKAAHGNGNGHGKSLEIEAARLANGEEGEEDAISTQAGPGEVLPDVRRPDVSQAVQRSTRGSDSVPVAEELLQDLREQQGVRAGGHAPMASASGDATDGVRGMRDGEEEVARSPQGSGRDEQRPIEPDGAVCELPPAPALERGPRRANGVNFGQYEAAVQRWEAVLGREAPAPTEPTGKGGAHRLSARFTEFLMGLPPGWITDVPGITRNEALKACGNGVVPQQIAEALRILLDRARQGAAA